MRAATTRRQRIMLFCVLLPFWISVLVRSFAWLTLLGGHGVLNGLLLDAGLIDEPRRERFGRGKEAVGCEPRDRNVGPGSHPSREVGDGAPHELRADFIGPVGGGDEPDRLTGGRVRLDFLSEVQLLWTIRTGGAQCPLYMFSMAPTRAPLAVVLNGSLAR